MEKDFGLASQRFCKVLDDSEGRWDLLQAVFGLGEELLTHNGDLIRRRKKHFKDILNLDTISIF